MKPTENLTGTSGSRKQWGAIFFFGMLFCSLLMFSCKGDPCQDIWCLNDGTCVDGTCVCEGGFSGERCEIEDLCYEIECQNGGTCVDGLCDCPGAWEGLRCDTLARLKFMGAYNVTQTCGTDTTLFSCLVSSTGNPIDEINFDNFSNLANQYGITELVTAKVTGDGLFFAPQTLSGSGNTASISGSGAYGDNKININFNVSVNGGSQSVCRQVFSQ